MRDPRPRVLEIARKATARARARGPAEVAGTLARMAAEEAWSHDALLVFRRPTPAPEVQRPGIELRAAAASDGSAYARDVGTDSPDTFARRLTADTDCYLLVRAGRIVHASWVTRSAAWTRELRAYLVPPPGDAYVYESYTAPPERGQGLYPFALTQICARLAAAGMGHLWVAVENRNVASLRAVAKAGFELALEIAYRRRFGRVIVDPARPAPGFADGEALRVAPRRRP